MEAKQDILNNPQSRASTEEEKVDEDSEKKNESCRHFNVKHDRRNFEDVLKRFDLYVVFKRYVKSLEDVATRQTGQEEHEPYFTFFIQIIERTSIKYQLDLLAKKQDIEKEMAMVFDTMKFVLNIVNRAVMKELDLQNELGKGEFNAIWGKQEDKNVSSMCECLFEFCLIKHLCFNSREFLQQSQRCILSFFQNEVNDFNKFQESAVGHLRNCIEECQNFLDEYERIQSEYTNQNIESINVLINEMKKESLRELQTLKEVHKMVVSDYSAEKKFKIFRMTEEAKSFESPFVFYVNMMMMCSLMMNAVSDKNISFENIHLNEHITKKDFSVEMYQLTWCYIEQKQQECELGNSAESNQTYLLEMRKEFEILLFKMNEKLKNELQIDSYNLSSIKKCFMENCMQIIDEFVYADKFLEGIKGRNAGEKPDFTPSNIETVEDAVKYFNLSPRLEELSKSLEDVKRSRKTKEDHELVLKDLIKDIQKLSLKYHPDKARSRGCSIEKIEEAQKLQAALNATRKILSFLGNKFLTDLDIDQKYEFYFQLNISLLGNEHELEKYSYKVSCKISYISEVKREITGEIRKFLTQSQQYMQSYIKNEEHSLARHYHSAIHHLRICIERYEKLVEECKAVAEECKTENIEAISSAIRNIEKESNKRLSTLNKIVAHSLEGTFCTFQDQYLAEDYFVKPFVRYMNLIVLCNSVAISENQAYYMRKAKEIYTKVERKIYSPKLENFNLKFDGEYEPLFFACMLLGAVL